MKGFLVNSMTLYFNVGRKIRDARERLTFFGEGQHEHMLNIIQVISWNDFQVD